LPADSREYGIGAQVNIISFKVSSVCFCWG
jgi:hypothetical protein